jgi:RNase P/RNase MRP subunit POP5
MSSPVPSIAELLTLRGGGVEATFGDAFAAGATGPPPARERVICLADQDEATLALAQQIQETTPCTLWIGDGDAPGKLGRLAALPSSSAIFPLSPAASAAESQSEVKRLTAWTQQQRLEPHHVLLQLTLPSASTALPPVSQERVRLLDKQAGAWLVRLGSAADSDAAVATLQTLLLHSSLPIVLAVTLSAIEHAVAAISAPSNITGTALRLLDHLATLPSLHRLHVAFKAPSRNTAASAGATTPLLLDLQRLEQHWAAMRRRETFRAEQQRQQAGNARPQQAGASSAAASSASATAAAVSTPVAAIAAPAAAPTFYRAAFTPTSMFFRVAVFFGSSPSSPISELTAYGLLTEAVRSLLGSVGLAKAAVQLLAWQSAAQQGGGRTVAAGNCGLVSIEASMTVGVRAALMLLGSYQGQACRIDVQQQSLFLATLAGDS